MAGAEEVVVSFSRCVRVCIEREGEQGQRSKAGDREQDEVAAAARSEACKWAGPYLFGFNQPRRPLGPIAAVTRTNDTFMSASTRNTWRRGKAARGVRGSADATVRKSRSPVPETQCRGHPTLRPGSPPRPPPPGPLRDPAAPRPGRAGPIFLRQTLPEAVLCL